MLLGSHRNFPTNHRIGLCWVCHQIGSRGHQFLVLIDDQQSKSAQQRGMLHPVFADVGCDCLIFPSSWGLPCPWYSPPRAAAAEQFVVAVPRPARASAQPSGAGQRLTAALTRVQGEGLQQQTAQQQQREVVSTRGRANPSCWERSGNRIQRQRTLDEAFPAVGPTWTADRR